MRCVRCVGWKLGLTTTESLLILEIFIQKWAWPVGFKTEDGGLGCCCWYCFFVVVFRAKGDQLKRTMELSDVGEHVFAAECIMMSRMNKVNNESSSILIHFVVYNWRIFSSTGLSSQINAELNNNNIYLGKNNQAARKGTGASKLATQKLNKEQ